MTRPCGCGGNAATTCNCVIVPGPNTAISGTGTPEDPYEISSGTTTLAVADTTSIDLTLTGSGAPYTVSGVVRRDPDPDNILAIGPGGVLVSCDAVQDCVGASVGPGLRWDAITRQLTARTSTDAGNVVTFGSDGGLYVDPAGIIIPPQPRARVFRASPQPIATGTGVTVVDYDTALTDNASMFTLDRLTAPRTGAWNVGCNIQWANTVAGNAGVRSAFIRVNGVDFLCADQKPAVVGTFTTTCNASTCVDLVAGDYIETIVQHTQGVSVNILSAARFSPTMWMYYVTEG